MKQRINYILLLIGGFGLSFKAFNQIPNSDSLQKVILESVKKGFDKRAFSNSFFDTSKLFSGKSPLDLDKIFKQVDKELGIAKSKGDINKMGDGYHHLSTLDSLRGNYKGAY